MFYIVLYKHRSLNQLCCRVLSILSFVGRCCRRKFLPQPVKDEKGISRHLPACANIFWKILIIDIIIVWRKCSGYIALSIAIAKINFEVILIIKTIFVAYLK
jgi:hypothetical protein